MHDRNGIDRTINVSSGNLGQILWQAVDLKLIKSILYKSNNCLNLYLIMNEVPLHSLVKHARQLALNLQGWALHAK